MPASHDADCSCFGCKARSVGVARSWGPARSERVLKERELPKRPNNAWERGKARVDGVPLVDEHLQPIPIKQYTEQRHAITDRLAATKAAGTIKE